MTMMAMLPIIIIVMIMIMMVGTVSIAAVAYWPLSTVLFPRCACPVLRALMLFNLLDSRKCC